MSPAVPLLVSGVRNEPVASIVDNALKFAACGRLVIRGLNHSHSLFSTGSSFLGSKCGKLIGARRSKSTKKSCLIDSELAADKSMPTTARVRGYFQWSGVPLNETT